MVLLGVPRKKSPVTPPGIDPGTLRLVAQCLNHYATPGPNLILLRPNVLVQVICVYPVVTVLGQSAFRMRKQ